MGFQDNSGDIFIDAVLTDEGRERLARNDGTFSIVRWRPADDEIDYRSWDPAAASDQKDVKILDQPIFESFTNEGVALKYPLISIYNARMQYLPKLTSNPTGISVTQQVDTVGAGAAVTITHVLPSAMSALPPDLFDLNFSVELDNDLIFLSGITPVSITPYGRARYVKPKDNAALGVSFNVRVQNLTTEMFDVLGTAGQSGREIYTDIIVTGQQSGLTMSIPVTIKEN